MTTLRFTVVGIAAPQGSKNVVTRPNGTRWVAEAGGKEGQERHRSWRAEVVDAAAAVALLEPFSGPVKVELSFRFLPVASDPYRTHHVTKPDADKLARNVLDALVVARVVADDSRVAVLSCAKLYCLAGEKPGVDVEVTDLAHLEAEYRHFKKERAKAARKKAS